MKTYRNFVNGKYVDAADGRTIPVINPSTEEQYATAPLSASADVDQAIQVAADAFETWRDSTPKDRSLALFRIADAIEARAEEFIALESENCGKPIGMTRSEFHQWSTTCDSLRLLPDTSKARVPANTFPT